MIKKEKIIIGLIVLAAIGVLVGLSKEKETQTIGKAGTPTTTEIEALGSTMAVSSIMQGLGKGTNTHKVLFIEVLEENYDTFLPGLMIRRDWEASYFRFDKEKKKIAIPLGVLRRYSPKMLNAQEKIRKDVSLVVKHTLNYKGIGRRYLQY